MQYSLRSSTNKYNSLQYVLICIPYRSYLNNTVHFLWYYILYIVNLAPSLVKRGQTQQVLVTL